MKKVITVTAAFLLFFTAKVFSQQHGKQWALKLSPQHLPFGVVRFEVEKVVVSKMQSVTLSPFVYVQNSLGYTDDELFGAGGELMHRLYFGANNKNLKGFYFTYGLNYHYLNFKFKDYGWRNFEGEEGLQYLKYGQIDQDVDIHRVGMVFMLGYQLPVADKVVFDFYHGIGMKSHFSPQGAHALNRYNEDFLDYSYNGVDLRVGVKFGFAL